QETAMFCSLAATQHFHLKAARSFEGAIMSNKFNHPPRRLPASLSLVALLAAGAITGVASPAVAQDATANATDNLSKDAPEREIVVVGNRGVASTIAPAAATLDATQPMSVINRTFIENAVADTADYTTAITLSPSLSGVNSNGPGLSERKTTLRGF